MRNFLAALAVTCGGIAVGGNVQAQQSMVVVELYTSQGCSSCPAADDILAEFAQLPNVIALGLHVDYWDYLGWKDELARPEFTERQAKFNTVMKSRYRLVTPQMIFGGHEYVAGAKRDEAVKYVNMLGQDPERAKMTLQRNGKKMRIVLDPIAGKTSAAEVHVVRFNPLVNVAIRGGENSGRSIDYVNTVTDWKTVGTWNGQTAVTLDQAVDAKGDYAVIVQGANFGPVLVARLLK
jgi:hypothetical protein